MSKKYSTSVRLFFRPFYRFSLLDLFVDKEAQPVLIYAALLIAAGAVLFHWIEKWGWLDSVYFTVVTITTIGFGDFFSQTKLGKIVTIFYGLNGVALLLMLFDHIRRIRVREFTKANELVTDELKKRTEPDEL